jgi:hypothetical protein
VGQDRRVPAIDHFLPSFDVHERHSIELPVRPQVAVKAALATPVAPDGVVGVLVRLRGVSRSGSIEATLGRIGFEVLERTPVEVVFAAGTPCRLRGGLRAFTDPRPGTVRVAADFRPAPAAGGCRLTTETKIAATDQAARRAFRRYWRLVGPFPALIRRRWLRAVSRRLARESSLRPR